MGPMAEQRRARKRTPGGVARRLAPAFAALAACAGAAAVPASGEGIPIPEIHIKLPKPQEVARFNVVVEGKATSTIKSQLSGDTGTCFYEEDGTVKDVSTYLRGKGATMEFDRYGKEVLIHRAGRESDSSLAVVVSTVRTAEGESSATPSHPPLPCMVPKEDLSTTKDCNVAKPESTKMQLTYDKPALRLSVIHGVANQFEDECGEDSQTGLQDDFRFAWPTPPPLEFANLSMSAIFGKRKALVVKFVSSDRHLPKTQHTDYKGGSIGGTTDESAFNEATVRLVRLKSG